MEGTCFLLWNIWIWWDRQSLVRNQHPETEKENKRYKYHYWRMSTIWTVKGINGISPAYWTVMNSVWCFISSVHAYQRRPTSEFQATNKLANWNCTFPSFTVCKTFAGLLLCPLNPGPHPLSQKFVHIYCQCKLCSIVCCRVLVCLL